MLRTTAALLTFTPGKPDPEPSSEMSLYGTEALQRDTDPCAATTVGIQQACNLQAIFEVASLPPLSSGASRVKIPRLLVSILSCRMSKCLHEGIDVAQRHYMLLGYSSGQVLSVLLLVQYPVQSQLQNSVGMSSLYSPCIISHTIKNGVMLGFAMIARTKT